MKPFNLAAHVNKSYFKMRVGIAVLGISLPFLLWFGGLYYDVPLQESMSAYYHASPVAGAGPDLSPHDGVMRNCFVGFLFAVGFMLFLYQGYSPRENIYLNIAGLMAIGVAIFPMAWPKDTGSELFSLHGACAVIFFFCIAAVCLTSNAKTLPLIEDQSLRATYKNAYLVISGMMVLSPLLAIAFTSLTQLSALKIFFIEAFGVFAFGTYWLVKSKEIKYLTQLKNTTEINLF